MISQTRQVLYGQEELLATLREFAGQTGDIPPNSVMLVADAGAGKTTLLEAAAEAARSAGARVAWIPGKQVGAEPFAPLRNLVGQLDDVLRSLPDIHQAALRSAVAGQADAVAPQIVLATAALSLYRMASITRPLLVIVDDVQSLDAGSADRLAFVARRLTGSRTRLLVASRRDAGILTEYAADLVLRVPPLTPLAAGLLVRHRFPVIPAAVRHEIIDSAEGNPRALVDQGYAAAVAGSQRDADQKVSGPAPDDEAARLMESAAAYARDRGEVGAAAASLQRAAELSSDPAECARRFAAAACVLIGTSGDLAEVERSLAGAQQARARAPGSVESLELVVVECYLAMNGTEPLDALRKRLVQCLQDQHDATADWVFEEAAWVLYGFCWFLNRPEVWAEFAALTARLAGRLPAWAVLAGPLMSGADIRRADLAAEADRLLESLPHEPRPWMVARMAQVTRYRDHRFGWRKALQRLWAERDEEGAVVPATYAAAILSDDLTGSGDWDAVHRMTKPALKICEDLGHWSFSEGWLLYMSARVAAHRGDATLVRRQTGRLLAWAGPRGAREMAARALHCRAIAALSMGDPVGAHRHLSAIGDPRGYSAELSIDPLMALDFAEAAAGAGAWDDVEELLTRIRATDGTTSDWRALQFAGALAIAATGRAGGEAGLDARYQRALAVPGADRWPFDLARIRLSYGERLRAAGRDDDARVQLRLAAATFRHLCSMPWLGRATNQFRALGDIRDRMPTGAPLAAMERRVADLAASGLTNREIAGQLRIPASTVSGQLSRVYAKLGVGSRAALRDALPPPPDRR